MKNDKTHPAAQGNETYISQNTTIIGSLRTDSSIAFDGRIEGALSSEGDVHITGTVLGDVSGQDITLTEGKVKGNLHARGDIRVNGESVIVGDMAGQNIDFNGKCKGNMTFENIVTLRSESLIVGNVSSLTVGMETGAIVRGEIHSTSETRFDESVFDDFRCVRRGRPVRRSPYRWPARTGSTGGVTGRGRR